MPGVAITSEYMDAVKGSIADSAVQQRKWQEAGKSGLNRYKRKVMIISLYCRTHTSVGGPAGITWEEMGNVGMGIFAEEERGGNKWGRSLCGRKEK
jgi:hypothetical protein